MSYDEWTALGGLLERLVLDGRTGVLLALLAIAAIGDCRTQRIPNRVVVTGAVYGLVYTTFVPPHLHGTVLFPLLGLVAGFCVMLPLYMLRIMGAGDVKLVAMTGTFLGAYDTLYAALASMIAGGVLAIVWAVRERTVLRLMQNVCAMLPLGAVVAGAAPLRLEPATSAGRMPYGVAIAAGTAAFLVLRQLGFV